MAEKQGAEDRRKARVRRAIKKAANGRPRLSVFRSSKQIYAQIIDDVRGVTVAAASTIEKDVKGKLKTGATVEAAKEVGKLVAERATQAGVKQVIFDRSGHREGCAGISLSALNSIFDRRRGTAECLSIILSEQARRLRK
jgi:large subunit ribosomal protein L18